MMDGCNALPSSLLILSVAELFFRVEMSDFYPLEKILKSAVTADWSNSSGDLAHIQLKQ
jgi:hypothetical protein